MSPTLLEHLRLLRGGLIRALIVVGLATTGLYMVKERLLELLMLPLTSVPSATQAIYTGVGELFFIYLKLCTWGGLFLVLPYILWEVWRFITPGLYAREKRLLAPTLTAIPLLFYGGGLFAYFFVVPLALQFFLGFNQPGLTAMPALREYLSFLFTMGFAFGLAFNLPVFIVLLAKAGLVSVAQLRAQRRWVIVIIFIVAAILTPPDPISQISMAIPLWLLYELAILAALVL